MFYKLLCLTKYTRLDQEESNDQMFWILLKEAIKGKIIVNTYWELAYTIKQTRRDRMANTASHITVLQLFYARSVCFLVCLSTIFSRNCVLTLFVIIFQFFKACYSVKNTHV